MPRQLAHALAPIVAELPVTRAPPAPLRLAPEDYGHAPPQPRTIKCENCNETFASDLPMLERDLLGWSQTPRGRHGWRWSCSARCRRIATGKERRR